MSPIPNQELGTDGPVVFTANAGQAKDKNSTNVIGAVLETIIGNNNPIGT